MIVVLGPWELAEALVAGTPGELVVGAVDDERLGGPVIEAAEVASALPLPARACVIAGWIDPLDGCDAVRMATGALETSQLYVIGDPPEGYPLVDWMAEISAAGAVPVRDVDELRAHLDEGRVHAAEVATSNTAATPEIEASPSDGDQDSAAAHDSVNTNPAPEPVAPTPPLATESGEPATMRVSAAERRAMRPGAPEAAAWREALRTAHVGRLQRLMRRRPLTDSLIPESQLDDVIRRKLRPGSHSIAVLSPKGGVGKTTLSFLLGSVLARVRRERVLVVDTNPDFGTLADLVPAIVPTTISDLLRDLDAVSCYEELSAYTTTTETGMQILAAPQDPNEMTRLGREGYQAVSDVLHRHYDLVVYDCGTGFLDEVTQFALRRVDHVVLVSTAALVTTKIVVGAIDHLGATGFDPSRLTLAVNMVHGGDLLDRRRLRTAMSGRVGGIVEVPFDERVQRAMDLGEFVYGRLSAPTRAALKRLAAEMMARIEVEATPEAGAGGTPDGEPDQPKGKAATPVDIPDGGASGDVETTATTPSDAPGGDVETTGTTAADTCGGAVEAAATPAADTPAGDVDATTVATAPLRRPRGGRLAFDWDPADGEDG